MTRLQSLHRFGFVFIVLFGVVSCERDEPDLVPNEFQSEFLEHVNRIDQKEMAYDVVEPQLTTEGGFVIAMSKKADKKAKRKNACTEKQIEGGYEDVGGDCVLTAWNWVFGGKLAGSDWGGCKTPMCDSLGGPGSGSPGNPPGSDGNPDGGEGGESEGSADTDDDNTNEDDEDPFGLGKIPEGARPIEQWFGGEGTFVLDMGWTICNVRQHECLQSGSKGKTPSGQHRLDFEVVQQCYAQACQCNDNYGVSKPPWKTNGLNLSC